VKRRGYTLFEIVIVVALLVLLAGLTIPSIESMYGDYRLQAAVDEVGGNWASLRARAIIEGRPYRFAVNGDEFRGAPDDPAYWSGGDPPVTGDSTATPLVVQDSLPRGIRFDNGDDSSASGPADSAGNAGTSPSSDGWSTLAVFLPDGTADQDVQLVFRSPTAGPITLQLRALTGGMSTRRTSADSAR
jgi:prepilin-type N-terminal cleavage/methylation domain-containing protein